MFRAPGVVFRVHCAEDAFLARLSRVFAALRAPDVDPPTVTDTFEVRDRGPAFLPSRWLVHRDGRLVNDASTPGQALDAVLTDLDDLVMQRVQATSLAVHAAAVERHGRVVLLPAASGSGKTTLAAAAVAAGARYVTDECVVIDRATMQVTPYPRPLCVKPGSADVVRSLLREPVEAVDDAHSWHVPPAALGEISVGGRLAAVIVPGFDAKATARLEPMSRAEAMLAVAGQAAFLAQSGPQALPALRDVVSGGPCYRLPFSDVRAAAALLDGALS